MQPAGAQLVRVDFRKYDGSPHRQYPALHLGSDDHGTWLGVSRPMAGAAALKYAEPFVLLVPLAAWWTAMFPAPPRRTEVYCDIVIPARWLAPDHVVLTDLDLDVRRLRAQSQVELLDEDEFSQHQVLFGYPAQLVEGACRAAAWLVDALGDGTEPFAAAYRSWLEQVS